MPIFTLIKISRLAAAANPATPHYSLSLCLVLRLLCKAHKFYQENITGLKQEYIQLQSPSDLLTNKADPKK
jgi:hypothetical protein